MTNETPQTADPAKPAPSHHDPEKKKPHGRYKAALSRFHNPARFRIGLLVVLGLAILVFGWWFLFRRGMVFSKDARFSGSLVDMGPEIGGRITEVFAKEGNTVRKDQAVFSLESSMQRAALAQSEAALESAKAGLAAAQARCERAVNGPRVEEINGAEAMSLKLGSEESLAGLELERMQGLRKEGAGTQDQLDRAATAYEAAKQSHAAAEQNLALLKQGTRKEDLDAVRADAALAKSRVAEADAAVARAKEDLDRCSVKAPFDGNVVRRWLDPGAMVSAGQPVVSLFDISTLRVDANIEEKYLSDVAIGDDVDVTVDAYGGLRLKGRVSDILRAANSEFSLVPAEGVSGTFIKVTQRVPLRISVSAPQQLMVGPGMSVEIRIHRGSSRHQGA